MPRHDVLMSAGCLLVSLAVPASAFAGTTEGDCLEAWTLRNFQPVSPTHGQHVESASYRGKVAVVMLLSSG